MSGKVIGVNSAIARVPGTTGSTGGSIGLGFAIPSDQARRTADQLIATGKATHPVIGVKLDRTFSGDGAQVVDSAGRRRPPGGPRPRPASRRATSSSASRASASAPPTSSSSRSGRGPSATP